MRLNNLVGYYKNGNYWVSVFADGTRIRSIESGAGTELLPDDIEQVYLKITNYCDRNCKFCCEGSSLFGKHAYLNEIKFIEHLHPYTKVVITGGNPLSHPELDNFLNKCKH